MGERLALGIGEASFGRTDTGAAIQDDPFCPDAAGFRRDGPHERNLELERGRAETLLQGRLNREPHAAVEQRRSEPAVHRAGWIELVAVRCGRHHHAPGCDLGYIIAQGLGHRIERQRPVSQSLHKLQAAHRLALGGADGPIGLGGN